MRWRHHRLLHRLLPLQPQQHRSRQHQHHHRREVLHCLRRLRKSRRLPRPRLVRRDLPLLPLPSQLHPPPDPLPTPRRPHQLLLQTLRTLSLPLPLPLPSLPNPNPSLPSWIDGPVEPKKPSAPSTPPPSSTRSSSPKP
ncbi:putative oxidoreductase TDA3 [Iris pallida]|uniref:Oxidoreductase TDA3 n=1 Tax=Iris pallida TaxID=29817 RepID=A0AAX6G1L7_IRIPA|nr:putative oxidoreductase TDA3 [Iris pallida]KAJ6835830.1 putative oxidoreductase TDA3 [Iris pallida]